MARRVTARRRTLLAGGSHMGRTELHQATLAALIAACRDETERFQRREDVSGESCFELLRRAIAGRDQAAWEAIFAQYRGMVLAWVRRHPALGALPEDDDYWINRTFERFWSAVGPERFDMFNGLAAALRYFKMCAHSVILDAARAQGAARDEALPEQLPARGDAADPAAIVGSELTRRALWDIVRAALTGDDERLVAELCFALDLKPREVYARHPDQFASVADVYRVKRNVLDRLRRNPALAEFLQ
ncbi:MAG: sigma-70 family RNA polymerase sigma factor [Thermomicrobiales bacterium]